MEKTSRFFSVINFGLALLVLFLYFLNDQLSIPQWLIPVGRMHMMVLHLPIGFMSLIGFLYFFKKEISKETFLVIANLILSLTSFTFLLAALCGLFLSNESGYNKGDLGWHMNAAIALSLLVYLLSEIYSKGFEKLNLTLIGSSIFLMVFVGHYGADITHGKDYLFPKSSIADTKALDAKTNTAFEIGIKPIFEAKCISCHNDKKSKGKLILTDNINIKKGGESGPLYIAGNSSISKLIEVINLPLKDEMHMAPDGKPQLTQEEILLLKYWVDSGASFSKKLNDYNALNSFRIECSKRAIKSEKIEVKNYSFSPASEATIAALNTSYTSVSALSGSSPALDATFFVSSQFKSENLKNLLDVKQQLVSLNLSNMPITDDLCNTIAKLSSLEKLILNGTKITSKGISNLASLTHLESLSLVNTMVDQSIEASISKMKHLKQLFVDNTNIKAETIDNWNKKYPTIKVFKSKPNLDVVELAKPILENNKLVFLNGEEVILSQVIKGATIRYTLDGTDPDSLGGLIYSQPIKAQGTMEIKARSIKEGWRKSPLAIFQIFEKGSTPEMSKLISKNNVKYPGTQEKTFFNGEKASVANLNDTNWIGFREEPLIASFAYSKPKSIKNLTFCYATIIPSYVFPPTDITIYAGDETSMKVIKSIKLPPILPTEKDLSKNTLASIQLDGSSYSHFKIVAQNLKRIPNWHPGKGEQGWLFVDEIFFHE
jgi:hypothetical protein